MNDPRILSLISILFAFLTTYSLYTGLRQQRDARRAGRAGRWYRNLSILTGIEYGLLTFVFLLHTASEQGLIAPGMQSFVGILYLVLLLPAAVFAGLVIQRVLKNFRASGQANRAAAQVSAATHAQSGSEEDAPRHNTTEQTQRQRERRKKAAAARRRQAGKA